MIDINAIEDLTRSLKAHLSKAQNLIESDNFKDSQVKQNHYVKEMLQVVHYSDLIRNVATEKNSVIIKR